VRASNITGSTNSNNAIVQVVPSSDSALTSLEASDADLIPFFSPATTAYNVWVSNHVSSIRITPTARISQSVIRVNGVKVGSGSTSVPQPLTVGANSIVIEVIAGNGTGRRIYSLYVVRLMPPVLVTDEADDVNDYTAVLNGTVNPMNGATVFFQYGTSGTLGETTDRLILKGTAPIPVSFPINGLLPDTDYHYRIAATTPAGSYFGDIRTFRTAEAGPLALTGTPVGVNSSSAILIGAVDPRGRVDGAFFQYGPTENYGKTTPMVRFSADSQIVDITHKIEGLVAGNIYHYRIVARGASSGFHVGENVSFKAGGGGTGDGISDGVPLVAVKKVVEKSSTSAVLTGAVTPRGGLTFVRFEYGLGPDYGRSTTMEGIGNGDAVVAVTAPVVDLEPGTKYHYRLTASNSKGDVFSNDSFFTTKPLSPLATTGDVAFLTDASVQLNGIATARGAATEVAFEYGTDGKRFPNSVGSVPDRVDGNTATPVTARLGKLREDTLYHYRVRAKSDGGVAYGETISFRISTLRGLARNSPSEMTPGEQRGRLRVNLLPSGIGGWRVVGESRWRPSGSSLDGLVSGDREIEYQPVPGFIQPAREMVSVVSGEPQVVLDHVYYNAALDGEGVLKILLFPEEISKGERAVLRRAQWRLLGDKSSRWLDSGDTLRNLTEGSYLVECKDLPDYETPIPVQVFVNDDGTTVGRITYAVEGSRANNNLVPIASKVASSPGSHPYGFVGKVRSDSGAQSGFIVRPRVVATAAGAVFNDASLAYTTGVQWLMHQSGDIDAALPRLPRGQYVFSGYDNQRKKEDSPGILSIQSQQLNVAALYFSTGISRRGYSGFLASDDQENPYLNSTALKTLVGYPVAGVPAANLQDMHGTVPNPAKLTFEKGAIHSSKIIRGVAGMVGGPLCVLHENGNYYPAAIHVGSVGDSVFREIDSKIVEMFRRAEISANGGDNNTTGGITHTGSTVIGGVTDTGGVKVIILPAAAVTAGAGWKVQPDPSFLRSGTEVKDLRPTNYNLEFKDASGFSTPSVQVVKVTAGKVSEFQITYSTKVTAPSITSAGSVTGTRGKALSYQISATASPTSFFITGTLPTGLTLNAKTGLISGTPGVSGVFNVTVGAINAAGKGTRVLTITSLPSFSGADLTAVVGKVVTWKFVSTETGISYVATGLPSGLVIDQTSGVVSGKVAKSGVFTVKVTASKAGASTTLSFTLKVSAAVTAVPSVAMAKAPKVVARALMVIPDPDTDTDGDGKTDAEEAVAGTDSQRGNDYFRILSARKLVGSYTVTAAGKASRAYHLERCKRPGSSEWRSVASTGVLSSDGPVVLTDSAPPNGSAFYRVRVTMP
jgi:hypothetical protein